MANQTKGIAQTTQEVQGSLANGKTETPPSKTTEGSITEDNFENSTQGMMGNKTAIRDYAITFEVSEVTKSEIKI